MANLTNEERRIIEEAGVMLSIWCLQVDKEINKTDAGNYTSWETWINRSREAIVDLQKLLNTMRDSEIININNQIYLEIYDDTAELHTTDKWFFIWMEKFFRDADEPREEIFPHEITVTPYFDTIYQAGAKNIQSTTMDKIVEILQSRRLNLVKAVYKEEL